MQEVCTLVQLLQRTIVPFTTEVELLLDIGQLLQLGHFLIATGQQLKQLVERVLVGEQPPLEDSHLVGEQGHTASHLIGVGTVGTGKFGVIGHAGVASLLSENQNDGRFALLVKGVALPGVGFRHQ